MSYAPQVFMALAHARSDGVPMVPRSPGDKEYFAQDWFAERLEELGVPFEAQGRNSYPDFLVGDGADQEGFEIKSLAFRNGKPARKDLDFNSTIPSGMKGDMDVSSSSSSTRVRVRRIGRCTPFPLDTVT